MKKWLLKQVRLESDHFISFSYSRTKFGHVSKDLGVFMKLREAAFPTEHTWLEIGLLHLKDDT